MPGSTWCNYIVKAQRSGCTWLSIERAFTSCSCKSSSWVASLDSTRVKGEEFVRSCQLRTGLVATPARKSRIYSTVSGFYKYCGGRTPATLFHILQKCDKSWTTCVSAELHCQVFSWSVMPIGGRGAAPPPDHVCSVFLQTRYCSLGRGPKLHYRCDENTR